MSPQAIYVKELASRAIHLSMVFYRQTCSIPIPGPVSGVWKINKHEDNYFLEVLKPASHY